MMINVMMSSYYDDADDNADDTQGRKLAAECSRTTRRSLKLGWPPGENIINDMTMIIIMIITNDMTTMIIIIITINNETEYGNLILRKELAQIESQGELGQLWWIPLSWTMTMVKG